MIFNLSCKNSYRNYGEKVVFDSLKLVKTGNNNETKTINLFFNDDPYKILNRTILVRLDTVVIYYGVFKQNINIPISIPINIFNRSVSPNLYIIDPGSKYSYYFESKSVITLSDDSKTLIVILSKAQDFSDRVKIEIMN